LDEETSDAEEDETKNDSCFTGGKLKAYPDVGTDDKIPVFVLSSR
jgi:hypothetical protein